MCRDTPHAHAALLLQVRRRDTTIRTTIVKRKLSPEQYLTICPSQKRYGKRYERETWVTFWRTDLLLFTILAGFSAFLPRIRHWSGGRNRASVQVVGAAQVFRFHRWLLVPAGLPVAGTSVLVAAGIGGACTAERSGPTS